jgi:hypothetical protein
MKYFIYVKKIDGETFGARIINNLSEDCKESHYEVYRNRIDDVIEYYKKQLTPKLKFAYEIQTIFDDQIAVRVSNHFYYENEKMVEELMENFMFNSYYYQNERRIISLPMENRDRTYNFVKQNLEEIVGKSQIKIKLDVFTEGTETIIIMEIE